MPSVVVSFELQNLRPPGHAARQPNCRHHRFRARIRKAHPLGIRNHLLQHLRNFQLDRRGGRKVCSRSGSFFNRLYDLRMRVTQRQRAKRHHPIDVLVAVDIVNMRTAPTLHEDWILAEVRRTARRRTAALN